MNIDKPDKGNDKPDTPGSDNPGHGGGGGGGPKPITIYVNTEPHTVAKDDISYEEVVKLAFPDGPTGETIGYTVLWEYKHGSKDGSLSAGQSVKTKDGMIFDVTQTNRS